MEDTQALCCRRMRKADQESTDQRFWRSSVTPLEKRRWRAKAGIATGLALTVPGIRTLEKAFSRIDMVLPFVQLRIPVHHDQETAWAFSGEAQG